MLIECKIRRQGGTRVELFGKRYHFVPAETGEHVCEVEDEDAIDRLLEITDAYRRARAGVRIAELVPPEPVPTAAPPRQPQQSIRRFIPEGAPIHIREMDREQLFQYAQNLGMRRPDGRMNTDRIRSNIQMFLLERDAIVRGDDDPKGDDGTGTVFRDPAGRDPHDDAEVFTS